MKRLKDPIYGYIDIETSVIDRIVDTPNFQRLRDIIQTSYSPLYSSAVHNRFVHSLGVYYLGKIVSRSIQMHFKECKEIDEEKLKRYFRVFEFACLLHDVGHAPFSHTGEEYYLGPESSRDQLHQEIISICKDQTLKKEIRKNNYGAAPHELMSVLVALRLYKHLFKSPEEMSFFARCITGYKYDEELNGLKTLLNCIIMLLNSTIIDVDKLDYLIRDAFLTGFETVSIDYERLLKNIRIKKYDSTYELVYSKGAISVIENVVYAHDAERKWIQNHPIVLYDTYLLRHAIEKINLTFKDKRLFSYDYLTYEGKELSSGIMISLLGDGDMKFLMKNIERDTMIEEYFSRKNRRHPLWKSEPEYKAIFNRGFNDNIFSIIEDEFEALAKYLNTVRVDAINKEAIDACQSDIKKIEEIMKKIVNPERKVQFANNLMLKRKHLKWLETLKEFAEEQNINFDFVVIKANQFNSGFAKTDFGELKIDFPELNKPCRFKSITNVLNAEKSQRDKFFYIFYSRDSRKNNIDLNYFASLLGQLAMKEALGTL